MKDACIRMPNRASLVVLALSLAAACRQGEPSVAEAPAADRGPRRDVFEQELLLTGELEAVRSIAINSPQTGLFQLRIQHLADEGSRVRAGDVILTFDSASLVAQVDDLETRILDAETQIVAQRAASATALKDLEIELAQEEHDAREAALLASVDADVLARKVWAERRLQLQKAERELQETKDRVELTRRRAQADMDVLVIARDKLLQDLTVAQEGLSLLTIRAPSDGLVVYERKNDSMQRFAVGDSCWPGQGILELPDVSEMRAVLFVDEVDAPLLREHMAVDFVIDAFPSRPLRGAIESIPSMAVKRSDGSRLSSFRVRCALETTWPGDMKPGMSCRGRIVVDRREGAPVLARREAGEKDGMLAFPRDAAAERRITFAPLARNARDYLLSEEDFTRLGRSSS